MESLPWTLRTRDPGRVRFGSEAHARENLQTSVLPRGSDVTLLSFFIILRTTVSFQMFTVFLEILRNYPFNAILPNFSHYFDA